MAPAATRIESAQMTERPNHWFLINSLLDRAQAGAEGLRPNYTWPVLHVASIAARTGREAVSVIEFGVAGGNGLIALEGAAAFAQRELGVDVHVYGFDTGSGLPEPRDHRDAPFLMKRGDFAIDVDLLRSRLSGAQLALGDVAETVPQFLEDGHPEVAFISFDLDYYSSTRDALTILRADTNRLLPRVLCYFDDTHGYPWGDSNGARLAIAEYNRGDELRKLDRIHGLRHLLPASQREQRWPEAIYLAHAFDHPAYNDPEGTALVDRLDLDVGASA